MKTESWRLTPHPLTTLLLGCSGWNVEGKRFCVSGVETPTRCHCRSDVQEFSCYRCGVAESTVRCCCGGVE